VDPDASGTATIQTCGAGTNFDTVLYIRTARAPRGASFRAAATMMRAPTRPASSELAPHPTVTAGQSYFIIVDGYSTSSGSFTLSVTPPGAAS